LWLWLRLWSWSWSWSRPWSWSWPWSCRFHSFVFPFVLVALVVNAVSYLDGIQLHHTSGRFFGSNRGRKGGTGSGLALPSPLLFVRSWFFVFLVCDFGYFFDQETLIQDSRDTITGPEITGALEEDYTQGGQVLRLFLCCLSLSLVLSLVLCCVLSCVVLCCLVLSCVVLCCVVLSWLGLAWLILALSYLGLSWLGKA
jgi:hypothetical protein